MVSGSKLRPKLSHSAEQPSRQTDTCLPGGAHESVRLIRPISENYACDELAAALNHSDEWMDRATIALRALDHHGAQTAFARVTVSQPERAALSFHMATDVRRCAQLTRAVHQALAEQLARVVPPSLLIDVRPLVHSEVQRELTSAIVSDLASSVMPLANSIAEANWRQAAVSAYIVAFQLARGLLATVSQSTPSVLQNEHDAAVWQLRMQRTTETRSLAEALACMRRTYCAAAFDFDTPFPQDRALLQGEAMLDFQRDLAGFEIEQRRD